MTDIITINDDKPIFEQIYSQLKTKNKAARLIEAAQYTCQYYDIKLFDNPRKKLINNLLKNKGRK